MFRVVCKFEVFPFTKYSEALLFKRENGGTMYILAYSQKYGRR